MLEHQDTESTLLDIKFYLTGNAIQESFESIDLVSAKQTNIFKPLIQKT